MYFTSFAKKLNSIRSYVKELQTTKSRFLHKKLFFKSKSSKNVRFRHRIALKPAQTCSTHDFTIRKEYEDKTKISKTFMDFSIFRRTVEISCFQKKNPRERCHLAFKCTYSLRQLYFTSSVKSWAESDHRWKSYKQKSDDFFMKNAHLRNAYKI